MTLRTLAILLALVASAGAAAADSVVASRTVRSRSVLTREDVRLVPDDMPGALRAPDAAVGMEARVVLYAGRPVRAEDLTAPAMIERNEIVTLVFDNGSLAITTDGRSLARAAVGEKVRVMNLQSRSTITGTVDAQGRVHVGPSEPELSRTDNTR